VERLRRGHAVGSLVLERDRLGSSLDGGRLGNHSLEDRAHLAHGLDRRDAKSVRDELARELPRPGAEVDDTVAARETE